MKKDKREIYAERKNCTISKISRIVSIDEDVLNDYDQEELYDISAQDCECEREYLVNHNKFQIVSIMRADEEVNYWTIEIEAIEED